MDERTICRFCGSHNLISRGIRYHKFSASRQFACKDCHKYFSQRLDFDEALKLANKTTMQKDLDLPQQVEVKTPPISWPEYNEAQMREKLLFLDILQDICSRLPETEKGQLGRPRAALREMVFCITAKLYEGMSSRRVTSDLTIAAQRGHIQHVPHFNTMLKYLNDPALTPLLTALIELSALPLKDFETTFAVDATGLSSTFYSRWLDVRLDPAKKMQGWLKVHLVCGTKSNIITALKVTDGTSNDSPHFPELVRRTAINFTLDEVYADKGYLSRNNFEAALELGALPYIPFKSNSTGKAGGSPAWKKLFYFFNAYREEFMARYHQRSNVEATFSALKRKFSSKLMMKGEIGQVNEALAMCLAYNITVLIREAFENGITTEFIEPAHKPVALHIKPRELVI